MVYRILKNPLYVGMVPHKDKVYPGEQKAIVAKAVWEEAQSLLAGNLVAKTRRKTEITTPFRGLLKCGHCGGSMGLNYTQKLTGVIFIIFAKLMRKRELPIVRSNGYQPEKLNVLYSKISVKYLKSRHFLQRHISKLPNWKKNKN